MATIRIYNTIVSEEERTGMLLFCGVDGTSFNSIDALLSAIPDDDNVIDLRLHCPGGYVTEGWAIVDKLRATGKAITATIDGICASMATVILLAASERKAAKHATLLIHDPYYPEYTLDGAYRADDLEKMAESLRTDAAKILDFYVERTGADRTELEELMKQSKFIGMERAKELGFIHEIIEPSSASAAKGAANWKKRINNQQSNSMSKKENNKSALAKALALVAEALGVTPRAVNYELNTATGDVITIDKPEGEDPAVGDSASPDGEHVMPDGTTIIVLDGVITEIRDAEEEGEGDGEELASAQARIAELESENETLRKSAKTTDEMRVLNLVKIAGGEAWLARAKSDYKPQSRTATPMPGAKAEVPAKASKVQQKLEALKKKNTASA